MSSKSTDSFTGSESFTGQMTSNQIAEFGKSTEIEDLIISATSGENDVSWLDGSKTFVTLGENEFIFDNVKNYYVANTFHEGILQSSIVEAFKKTNGIQHPNLKLNRTYEDLTVGGRMQKSDLFTYLKYTIEENGVEVLNYEHPDYGNEILAREHKTSHFNGYHEINQSQPSINIYPNPAEEFIVLDIGSKINDQYGEYSIYSVTGKLMLNSKIVQINTVISLEEFPSGLFWLKYNNQSFNSISKFVKQ